MIIEIAFRWTEDDNDRVWMRGNLTNLESFGAVPRGWALSRDEQEAVGEDRNRLVGNRLCNRFFALDVPQGLGTAVMFRDWVASIVGACAERAEADWWRDKTSDGTVAALCADIYRERLMDTQETYEAACFIVQSMVDAQEQRREAHV